MQPRAADPRWGAGHSAQRAAFRAARRPQAPGPWAVLAWPTVVGHRFAASRSPVGQRLCPRLGAGYVRERRASVTIEAEGVSSLATLCSAYRLSMDTLTPDVRRNLMSRIRAKDTKPEMVVRRLVHAMGYRYLLHDKRLPGRPDLVFPGRHSVIFVHGCFWHRHSCGRGFSPSTNAEFWQAKLDANVARDCRQVDALTTLGWRVLVVWECETHVATLQELETRLALFLGAAPEASSRRRAPRSS